MSNKHVTSSLLSVVVLLSCCILTHTDKTAMSRRGLANQSQSKAEGQTREFKAESKSQSKIVSQNQKRVENRAPEQEGNPKS